MSFQVSRVGLLAFALCVYGRTDIAIRPRLRNAGGPVALVATWITIRDPCRGNCISFRDPFAGCIGAIQCGENFRDSVASELRAGGI